MTMKNSLILAGVLAGGCGVVLGLAKGGSDEALMPELRVDRTPPERSGPAGGHAATVEKVAPSVVSIFTTREAGSRGAAGAGVPEMFRDFFGERRGGKARPQPRQRGLGSGVILSPDGYILTNHHVIKGADRIKVRLDNRDEHAAELVAGDPASDLAVIKVDADGLPAATLGDSELLKPGDFVLALGSPFGLSHTVTQGIVSAIGRDNLNIAGYENFIQTDASINPGNSGGALVDNSGRVVGINTAIFSRSGGNVGIGFAIPINMAIEIAEQLIDAGEVRRGYLGVRLGALDPALAEALGVEAEGALVNEVMPGTPAAEAGLEAGDVIVAVDGRRVEDLGDLRRMVGREQPGTELVFEVRRGDEELELSATIAAMPGELLAGDPGAAEAPERGALRGVELERLDEATRERLELSSDLDGVVVRDLEPASPAAEAGLRPGHVILEIDREPVGSPAAAYRAAAAEDERPVLLRVHDGKAARFLAIG